MYIYRYKYMYTAIWSVCIYIYGLEYRGEPFGGARGVDDGREEVQPRGPIRHVRYLTFTCFIMEIIYAYILMYVYVMIHRYILLYRF